MPEDQPMSLQARPRTGLLLMLIMISLAIVAAVLVSVRVSPAPSNPRKSMPGPVGRRLVGDEPSSRFAGAAACVECHPGEAALQERSGHQRTLWRPVDGPLVRWLTLQRLRDPERPDVVWSYRLADGRLFADRSGDGRTTRFPLEFAFGSGKQGVTF